MSETTSAFASQLEVVDVTTRERQIVYRANGIFEAPNWTPDDRFFIFNRDGLLYRLNRAGGEPEQIDTGFANRLNNDHGLSPDGKRIVISHHAEDADGGSLIYTLPIEGGMPVRITDKSPSYWHGWSPDGNTLAYVAGRPAHADFKIYAISVVGGEEHQLTFGPGLDDGPDYAPDGRHIYYNSYRSGTMQIWRMEADGANPEQLTHAPHSDWFPHPSPDGRYLVFIRYLKDQGQRHPFGQDVQLMLMDLASGALEPLTEVFFGGQGSLNVPSWSPDSRHLAFVSYLAR